MGLELADDRLQSEPMACECDIASRAEARALLDALDMQKNKLQKRLDADFDGENCVSCGDEINPKRIEALKYTIPMGRYSQKHDTDLIDKRHGVVIKHGTDRCVQCESIADLNKKRYAEHAGSHRLYS